MRLKLNIGSKIGWMTFVVVVTAVAINSGIGLYKNVQQYKVDLVGETQAISNIIARQCQASIIFNDEQDAEQILQSLVAFPIVDIAQVLLPNQTVFAAFKHNSKTRVHTDLKQGFKYGSEHLYLVTAIMDNDLQIGWLYMEISLVKLNQSISDSIKSSVVSLSISLLIAMILVYFLQKTISGPIKIFQSTVTNSTTGIPQEVVINSTDEIGELAKAFNSMRVNLKANMEQAAMALANEKRADALEEAKKKLERSNKDLERFTYMATHDLKVPVSNMEGSLALLRQDLENSPARVLEVLDWMEKSIAQANSTIGNLVSAYKFKQQMFEFEDIDMSSIFTEIMQAMSITVQEAKVQLTTDFSGAPVIPYGRVAMGSILQNLMSNAIKYADDQRPLQIKVTTGLVDNYYRLSVQDNGLGIDLERHKNRLFEMFSRIHVRGEGSGIGLYIIKEMVERLNGRIEVESQEGIGSNFIIYFAKHDDELEAS